MSKAAQPTTNSAGGRKPSILGTLGLDLLDTTWRIAVPVLIFSGTGIFVDVKVGSGPWFTLLGMAAGFVLAFLLVKKQLAAVDEQEGKEK